MIDADLFKRGMRRLASGVSIISTSADGTPHGLLVTSVTSLSTEPASMLVCVNKGASAHDPMARAGVFCVNVLHQDDDEVAGVFSRSQFRDRRFTESRWTTMVTGAPALRDALANFDCRVTDSIAFGSHTIFIGEVMSIRMRDGEVDPLIYLNGQYRQLATPAA